LLETGQLGGTSALKVRQVEHHQLQVAGRGVGLGLDVLQRAATHRTTGAYLKLQAGALKKAAEDWQPHSY